jgi:hypothetical protein
MWWLRALNRFLVFGVMGTTRRGACTRRRTRLPTGPAFAPGDRCSMESIVDLDLILVYISDKAVG